MDGSAFGVISTVDSKTKLQDGTSDSWHPECQHPGVLPLLGS